MHEIWILLNALLCALSAPDRTGPIPKLTGIIRAAFARSDFVQSTRWDNEADMSVGLRYRLIQHVFLGVDYRYTQRVSDYSLYNFNRNQIYADMTVDF